MVLQLLAWAPAAANPMIKMEKAPMKLLVLSEAVATMGVRWKGHFPTFIITILR